MFCYWGGDVKGGFGLVKPANVKETKWGISFFYPKPRIRKVSVGGSFIGFIREDGNVSVIKLQGDGKPKNIDLKKQRIKLMVCGQAHAILLAYGGNMLFMNKSLVCRAISCRNVKQIACGDQHSIALTYDGQLFTWGLNFSGQLGLGKGKSSPDIPRPLIFLSGVPLAQISAGGDHSFALSLSGTVFGWGKNSSGQLGLGDREDRFIPTCVNNLSHKKTLFISCGGEHTATLSKGGTVFTFGSGLYGQLGHNSLKDELRPRVVSELWGLKVSQISCGRHHTLAMVGEEKAIYSFGYAGQGQLRHTKRINKSVPLPVHLPPGATNGHAVDTIFAGGSLSFAWCSSKNSLATPEPTQRRGILTLGEKMIARWLSKCDSNEWKAIKNDIETVFSSAACLNGSFLEQSCDGHFQTSTKFSGLDLESVRYAMKQIALKEKVLLEVEKVVKKHLIPSLDSSVAGVEALRVYLILPELLNVLMEQQRGKQLTVALASAILKLDKESLDLLTNMWSRLPYNYYCTLVRAFHSVSANIISQVTTRICNYWREALEPLHVLRELYSVNNKRLSESDFYVREIIDFCTSNFTTDIDIDGNVELKPYFVTNMEFLIDFPFILDLKTKHTVFKLLQENFLCWFGKRNLLSVNRKTVLADTLKYLKENVYDFPLHIEVNFIGENGVDCGGLSREYFRLLGKEITKSFSGIQASADSGLFWFSSDASGLTDDIYYLGVICGMAFYNDNYTNVGFPLALFKKLLKLPPTLDDLEELFPVQAKSLRELLMEEVEEVVEMLYLDFTVDGKELIPNGGEIPVTKINRKKFVDLYVDFLLNKSVEKQFREFEKGFSRGNPCKFWTMFLPEELRLLLYGPSEYDWAELQKCATYEHCVPADELIKKFWTVFYKLSEEEKKKFLCFLYATDRPPLGGLAKQPIKIVKCNFEDADDRYPKAETCSGVLNLPNYSNIDILQEKLIYAFTHCENFGLS